MKGNRVTNILLVILIVFVMVLTFLRIIDRAEIDRSLQKAVDSIELRIPKDGQNATPDQIKAVVTEYFKENPVYVPKDGVTRVVHEQTTILETVTLPGIVGGAGKSAYELAVDAGFVGTQEEWLLSLQPPVLRCNEDKNRWEAKYPLEMNWQALNGEVIPCVGLPLP